MADKRIDELTALASVETTDLLPVWDTSAGQTKNIPVGSVSHTKLADIGTNTHAQIDTFIGTKAQASGLASLNASSLVVQNPANATATPTASKIPIADISGKLNSWVDAELTANQLAAIAGTSGTPSGTNKFVTNDDTATAATADKVARRLAGGNITVVTETQGNNSTNAASTAYVDTGLASISLETGNTAKLLLTNNIASLSTSLSSGSVTKGAIATVCSTGGTTSGNKAVAHTDANADASKDFVLVISMKLTSVTNRNGGFFIGATPTNVEDNTNSGGERAGFVLMGTTLYSVTKGSSNVTATDVSSGITVTNYNTYKIKRTGSNIYFYINGTLVATHTTNLPTSAANAISVGIANSGTSSGTGTLTWYSNMYYEQTF